MAEFIKMTVYQLKGTLNVSQLTPDLLLRAVIEEVESLLSHVVKAKTICRLEKIKPCIY